jgi:SAM-dependent methyltransferase
VTKNREEMAKIYNERRRKWLRWLMPPPPVWHDPRELELDAPLGKWNLYIGSAGTRAAGYVNLDLFALPGVDVAANAERLPFPDNLFQRVECDAVLEHVERPEQVAREIERVLRPGGYAHLVTPFCHPYHAYPADFRRYTLEGLAQLAGDLEIVKTGWRTGPTATLLVMWMEWVKLWMPTRALRGAAHFACGWLAAGLRYLDIYLMRKPRAGVLGNHGYVWLRKRLLD